MRSPRSQCPTFKKWRDMLETHQTSPSSDKYDDKQDLCNVGFPRMTNRFSTLKRFLVLLPIYFSTN